jgi:hypothetical protein
MRDYYPGLNVKFAGNHHTPEDIWESGFPARYQVTASRPQPPEYRKVFKSWKAYDTKRTGVVDEADIVAQPQRGLNGRQLRAQEAPGRQPLDRRSD